LQHWARGTRDNGMAEGCKKGRVMKEATEDIGNNNEEIG
jgi:hypothetical protein